MSVYLDTSVILALLSVDSLSERALRFAATRPPLVLLGDLARAEFAAVIARRIRTGNVTAPDAAHLFAVFDAWAERTATRVPTESADLVRAEMWLRRPGLNLRTQDAIHIATADRLGASLATFDVAMATAARQLGAALVEA